MAKRYTYLENDITKLDEKGNYAYGRWQCYRSSPEVIIGLVAVYFLTLGEKIKRQPLNCSVWLIGVVVGEALPPQDGVLTVSGARA